MSGRATSEDLRIITYERTRTVQEKVRIVMDDGQPAEEPTPGTQMPLPLLNVIDGDEAARLLNEANVKEGDR